MEIFNKHLFGKDAEQWLKLCKDSKKEWILKYTNQSDETLIDDFIQNPKISKECKCLDCGKNGNISKTISNKIESVSVNSKVEGTSGGGNKKRRGNNKGS